jgi:hypothetical protein
MNNFPLVNNIRLHIHKILLEAHKTAVYNDHFVCFISVYEIKPAEERGIPDFFKKNKDVRVCRNVIILAQNAEFCCTFTNSTEYVC